MGELEALVLIVGRFCFLFQRTIPHIARRFLGKIRSFIPVFQNRCSAVKSYDGQGCNNEFYHRPSKQPRPMQLPAQVYNQAEHISHAACGSRCTPQADMHELSVVAMHTRSAHT
jgi:hypothetical protein